MAWAGIGLAAAEIGKGDLTAKLAMGVVTAQAQSRGPAGDRDDARGFR